MSCESRLSFQQNHVTWFIEKSEITNLAWLKSGLVFRPQSPDHINNVIEPHEGIMSRNSKRFFFRFKSGPEEHKYGLYTITVQNSGPECKNQSSWFSALAIGQFLLETSGRLFNNLTQLLIMMLQLGFPSSFPDVDMFASKWTSKSTRMQPSELCATQAANWTNMQNASPDFELQLQDGLRLGGLLSISVLQLLHVNTSSGCLLRIILLSMAICGLFLAVSVLPKIKTQM